MAAKVPNCFSEIFVVITFLCFLVSFTPTCFPLPLLPFSSLISFLCFFLLLFFPPLSTFLTPSLLPSCMFFYCSLMGGICVLFEVDGIELSRLFMNLSGSTCWQSCEYRNDYVFRWLWMVAMLTLWLGLHTIPSNHTRSSNHTHSSRHTHSSSSSSSIYPL